MILGLKGITDIDVFRFATNLGFSQLSFDLRPRSFNFTQGYKIKEILEQVGDYYRICLQFDGEKKFVMQEITRDIESDSREIFLEIENPLDLKVCNELGYPFALKYKPDFKLSELKSCHNLERLIFTQDFIEELNQQGELYGFFDVLRSELPQKLEILTDWDSALISSLIETYEIDVLSWEINNKIEVSYRNIDFDLLESHMQKIEVLMSQGDAFDNNRKEGER